MIELFPPSQWLWLVNFEVPCLVRCGSCYPQKSLGWVLGVDSSSPRLFYSLSTKFHFWWWAISWLTGKCLFSDVLRWFESFLQLPRMWPVVSDPIAAPVVSTVRWVLWLLKSWGHFWESTLPSCIVFFFLCKDDGKSAWHSFLSDALWESTAVTLPLAAQ